MNPILLTDLLIWNDSKSSDFGTWIDVISEQRESLTREEWTDLPKIIVPWYLCPSCTLIELMIFESLSRHLPPSLCVCVCICLCVGFFCVYVCIWVCVDVAMCVHARRNWRSIPASPIVFYHNLILFISFLLEREERGDRGRETHTNTQRQR